MDACLVCCYFGACLFHSCFACRRLTGDASYFATILRIDERTDEGGVDSNAPPVDEDVEGGVSESVIQDLKGAFGTDFQVDPALIDAILRRNCIAFVGAGFSQNETKMTWDCLIQKLLVRARRRCLCLPSPPPSPTFPFSRRSFTPLSLGHVPAKSAGSGERIPRERAGTNGRSRYDAEQSNVRVTASSRALHATPGVGFELRRLR